MLDITKRIGFTPYIKEIDQLVNNLAKFVDRIIIMSFLTERAIVKFIIVINHSILGNSIH